MEDNFNVGTPSKENIDYAFKNLIYYLNAARELDVYIKYKKDLESIIERINKVLSIYVNNERLSIIDEKLLKDIQLDLMEIDDETKLLPSYFAEWAEVYLEAIISLRQSEIKTGDSYLE